MRALPKEHLEEAVRVLTTKYPACFFEDWDMRRPLKADIKNDLVDDGASEQVIAGLGYYTRSWGYLRCLQAGVERVDLNGKKVGTVTETEQRAAQKQLKEEQEQLKQRKVSVIPTDALSKPSWGQNTMKKTTNNGILTRLHILLASANTTLEHTDDEALRAALAVAALKLLAGETQKVIGTLSGDE
jgi:sRNA-binding protein